MKKLLSLVLAVLMCCVLFAGCGEGGNTNKPGDKGDKKIIKIGIFEPGTGQNAGGGKQEVLGIRYANSVTPTVDINGETYTIELVEVDNASDTAKAVTAAQSLVSSKVSVVLGSYGSGVSIAAGSTFKDAKIPAIGCSCTNPQVTEGNDYYFRVCFLDPFQGTVMADFAKEEKKAQKAGVLYQAGDDYSAGLANYFMKAFKDAGGEVVEASFQAGETDFSAIVATFVKEKVDIIFAPSSIETAPYVIKQARSNGITCPIMGGDTWENETIIKNSGASATDVFLSTFFDENDTSNPAASTFVKGFKAWLKANPQMLTNNGGTDGVAAVSALGYDSYMSAIEAIKIAKSTSGADICKAISQVNYDGVTGNITFNENGDANNTMAYIKTIENGAFKFLKTQSVK
jgi:branched-chain amino acid transport system substrate-binding protein